MKNLLEITLGTNVTIEDGATVGKGVAIYDNSFVRKGAVIGDCCKIARGVYIDGMAVIGNNVKIQNRNNISNGVILKDGVFVGPNVTFSNDKYPRAINADGTLKNVTDWKLEHTVVETGASIGAGAVIICGVVIGEWSMIGAGAVVTKNIPPYAMVIGNPAKIKAWVSKSGYKMDYIKKDAHHAHFFCNIEKETYKIPIADFLYSE